MKEALLVREDRLRGYPIQYWPVTLRISQEIEEDDDDDLKSSRLESYKYGRRTPEALHQQK